MSSQSNSPRSGSSVCGHCSSVSSNPCSSSARLHQANSPHGILPLRQLVPIKIDDRESCFVIGISPSIATEETLRSSDYFGQFGTIKSIRFILNSEPRQALIRFTTAEAASRAIAWCNSQKSGDCPISAKYGYQKYCISFIKNKQCLKVDCPHRHRWCTPSDVITVKNQRFRVSETPQDIFSSTKKKKKNKGGVNNMHNNKPMSASRSEQLLIVQHQFSILQAQCTQQNESIKVLLAQMKAMQSENVMLRQQVKQLTRQQQQSQQQQRSIHPLQQQYHQSLQQYVPYYPSTSPQKLNEQDDLNLVDDIVDSLFLNERPCDFVVSESSDSI